MPSGIRSDWGRLFDRGNRAGVDSSVSPVHEVADDVEGTVGEHEHAAADVSYGGSTNLSATDVEAALDELDAEKASTGSVTTVQTNLDNHINDTSDAHDASAISIVDSGAYYTGTDVEAALQEAATMGGGATDLDDLTDAAVSSPSTRQGLFYDGTNFVNQFEPGQFVAPTSKTATFTALLSEMAYSVSASGGAVTANLPTAVGCAGKEFFVKKTDSSANTVTLDPNGSETINGAATLALSTQHEGVSIESDGTNWFITSRPRGGDTSPGSGTLAVEEDGSEEGTGIDRLDITEGLDLSVSGSQATISAEAASETNSGISERADQTETNTGTDDQRHITPLKLKTFGDNRYVINSGGLGTTLDLDNLGDVVITSPANGAVLKYNSTSGQWEDGTDLTGSGGGVDEQLFTSSGTWSKPSGATTVTIICQGGGGGGGAGRRGAASTVRAGGGGGGGGGRTEVTVPASSLASTEAYAVGGGGSGGAAQTSDSSSGASGGAGGNSTFGTTTTICSAFGGNAGGGGSTAQGTGGAASDSAVILGGDGRNGASTSTQPGSPNAAAIPGGGGGGAISGTNVTGSGGPGGTSHYGTQAGSGGGTGASGTAGESRSGSGVPGGSGGGGGGGNSAGGAAGAGGNGGAYGAGGGGGGGSLNGSNSGAGGNGGAGFVLVISHLS